MSGFAPIALTIRGIFLLLFCLLLPACVRYDDEGKGDSQDGQLSLEEIKRQLDAPLHQPPPVEPTEAPSMRERWKAYGKHDNGQVVDQEKKLATEIYQSQANAPWPPDVGFPYPPLQFMGANGQKRSLEEFRGRMVLIEYASMASAATQALSGSNERGPYGAVPILKQFKLLEKYFPEYSGGVGVGEVVRLQILLVDPSSRAVSQELAAAWSKHFDLESKGRIVVIGTPALLRNEGSQLLGGFQLLDKNHVVRVDATRERSKTLFSVLFPAMARIR